METISELLRQADPLREESDLPRGEIALRRQAVVAAALDAGAPVTRPRWKTPVFASFVFVVLASSFLGWPARSLFVNLQAAVRFEVRLAESSPAPGLREVRVAGSQRPIYLHQEIVVANGDIATARVIPGGDRMRYSIAIEFSAAGGRKMSAATKDHVGRPMAILIDGQVVAAPTLRAEIGASAVVSGNFAETDAKRIVDGIRPE